ncbi:phage tail protein [Avibacterium paragallinarum]|nr:phage tail protein [Avibacterium paragallinarum]
MGKGGGGGHTPVEAPESGRSKQLVNIVEIISEGEIQGLVNGVKSVFLDKTPIQANDGSYNFNNVDAQGRIGVQDQDIMEGFNTSEKEVAVSAQVRKTVAITRTITDSKVSRLRLTLGVQSLFSQNDQGDTNGTRVELRVTIGSSIYPVVIEGKYSSQYLRQFEYGNLPPVPFQVRVERLTDDSKSQRLQNNTVWSSYTEIIETQFAYPNTALVGIQFDSEYFGSIPNRNYEIYGIKLKVPSNYNPISRTYTRLWDGTFKIAWSNNPAWVLYDLMTNKRYGLGQRLGEFSVDKWTLYQVAQYCDQLVPDGFGGKEPRFTCNAWLTDQRKAYDVINDICSIFRAMPVWNGREFTVVMDRPADPVWTYTNANVVNGEFSYQYSALKARHNEIHVEYIDASDSYEKKVEVVSDDALIRRYGLNIKKVTAFGCTSRGQAHRTGKWILETERLETKTVTFSVGAEGLMHIPGDVIRVADSDYAATNIGGRVLAIDGRKAILDREIEINGKSYLTYINAEGKHKDIRILGVAEGNQAVLETMPEDLVPYTVWSLTTQQINVQLFKCLTISEEEKGKYTIVALQHEPQKEAIVDNGAVFEPRETTLATSGLRKVDNLQVQANGDGIELSFDAIVANSAMVKYQIKLYRNGRFYKLYDDLTTPKITFVDLPDGEYIAEVRAQNAQGQLSDPVTKTFTVRLAVSELVTVPKMFAIELNWRNPIFANPKTAIEIWVSSDNQFANARKLVSLAYPTNSYTYSGLSLNDRFWFWVRMVDGDNAGRFTAAVEGQPSQDATALTDYLHGQITKSELGQSLIDSLQADIDTAVDAETQARLAALKAEVTNRTKAIQSESTKLTAKIQAEANARGTAISQLQNIDAQQAQKMTALTAKAEQALSGLEAERIARASGDEAEARERRNLTSRVASAESGLSNLQRTVSTQAQSLSEVSQNLNARFDSLQIGGRNYILSSKSSITSSNVDNGRRYFELSKALPVDVSTLTISVYVNVVGNRNTTYANNNRAGVGVKIEFIDDSVSWFEVWTSKSDIKGRISRTATYNKRIKNIGSVFMLNFLDAQTSIVSDPKLELGTVATDWTPAPEDLEGAVEAVSADLTNYKSTQASVDNAQAQQLSNLTSRISNAESGISNIQSTKANKTEVASLARTTLQSEWRRDAKAEVDNIKVGGRNYILSSKSSITSGNVDNGRRYFELSKALPVDVSTLTISVYVNVVGNRNTTYANNNRAGVGVKIEFIDDSVSWFEVWTSKSDIKGRISRTATYNKRIKNIGSVFMLNFLDAQTSIVSDPKLELGTVATDWTPAPEDLEGAVEAVSAKVDSTRETLTRANQALGQRIDTVNASVNDAKAQISTVSRAVATTDGKLSATHTIKTQTIAGGRKAIAGIALGASGDNRTAESSVIVMADKFGVVKNASDGNVVPMLSVVNNRVAVNGDLIADGTILGKHIRANQTISAPNITGGSITGTTITGNRINGGTINGSTIEGGIIRGTRLEGATGKFTGQLEVTEIVGSNIYESFIYEFKYYSSRDPMRVNIYIEPRPVDRMLWFSMDNVNIRYYKDGGDYSWSGWDYRNTINHFSINGLGITESQNYFHLAKNTKGNITLKYNHSTGTPNGRIRIDAFIANSARTIHL